MTSKSAPLKLENLRFSSTKKESYLISENRIENGDPVRELDVFLSPESVARYLDVSRKFIYEMMARGEIKASPIGGRLKRIRLSALEAWINRQNDGG